MSIRPAVIVAAAIALAGGGRAAAAAPSSSWQVPAECGGGAAMASRIAQRAGHRLVDGDPITVDIAIDARAEGGYRATVDLYSVRGTSKRQVEGGDCAVVVDAVALLLAVAMEEVRPAGAEIDAPVARPPRAPARFMVGAGVGVDQGVLPAASPGASVTIALGSGRLRLEVSGEIYQAAFAPTPMNAAKGVEVGLLGARLRLCRRVGPLRGCAGGALARLEGRPVDLSEPSTESRRWSALMAGLGWSYRFGGRFALSVDVDGLLAIDRPLFVSSDSGELILLHQPAAGGVRAAFGLEVEIR